MFFSSTPPTRVPIVVKLESKTIDIPAGEPNYVIEDSYVLPVDVSVVSVYPHAHYLAREMRGTATLPDGSVKPLVWIKQWDIRWQDQYRYKDPLTLETALKLKPNDDRIRFNRANALTAAGRSDEAIREFERVIAINPENADAHFNLAMLLGPLNRLDEAIAHLRRVIEINPRNAEAHRNLAVAVGLQGKLDEAIAETRAALRIQPDSTAARQQLDRLLAARGGVR